ncbi:MAG TPA: response regulator [Myxococcales bacterium]
MSKKILLIDSDESFGQGLSHAIASHGFSATLATNSEQGMSMAKEDSPDLIVVCVEAQPTNGYMLCTRLKKDEQLKGIPIILTSANATPDSFEKHKKLKTRAEEYLIKPFEPIVMLEKASQLLGVQLPAGAGEEEILSVDDEPLGLGELVPGDDEPISLAETDVAEAHGGSAEEPLVVEEVEEVQELSDDESAHADDDLAMFDKAFDSLGAPPSSPEPHLQVVPDDGAEMLLDDSMQASAEESEEVLETEEARVPPADLSAPDDSDVLSGLSDSAGSADGAEVSDVSELSEVSDVSEISEVSQGSEVSDDFQASQVSDDFQPELAAASADDEVRAHLETRVAELEHALAERDAELAQLRKGSGPASSSEVLRLKEAKNRADKELLRLKEELNAKEKELVDLQERETTLETQAQTLKDDAAKRDASTKALQQRADALAAAAKKFERELTAAREEAKKAAQAQGKASETEKAHEELRKKHDELAADAEAHKERAGQLETELAGAREMHGEAQAEAQKAREELDKHKADLAAAVAEAEKHKADATASRSEHESSRTAAESARSELEQLRAELETLRTDAAALTGEKDLLSEERDDLRKQLEEAQAAALQNEERAVKAYQKIKTDERLREKTRKALQIALQLLEDDAEDAEVPHAEKKSA